MFGFKRRKELRQRRAMLFSLFNKADKNLSGWEVPGKNKMARVKIPIPATFKDSPLYMKLFSDHLGYYDLSVYCDHAKEGEIKLTRLVLDCSFLEDNLREPENNNEQWLIEKALKILQEQVDAATLAKLIAECQEEHVRLQIVKKAATEPLTENSVLDLAYL
jgi:hypothetical protein